MAHHHAHEEGHRRGHPHEHENQPPQARTRWHKDWRVWTGLILMLVAITVYALTVDESIIPGLGPKATRPQVPAAP